MTAKITATLSQVLSTAIESYIDDLTIALPCRVLSYDPAKQTAKLQPEIKKSVLNTKDELDSESLPALPNVPVAFPRAGDWFLSMPVAVGDKMYVIFSSRSISEWRKTGAESLPEDQRVHPLNGAVAIPGNLYPDSQALGNVHANDLVIGKDTGARIYVKDDEIHLYEENASQFVALAQKVFDEIDALRSFVATHTHSGVQTGAGTSGTPVGSPPAVNSVAAAKVKAT